MYLRGLEGVFDSSFTSTPNQQLATSASNTMALQTSMQYNSCLAAHGYWNGSTCTFPSSGGSTAPANITVTVPTNVSTQVSPQISPNLIQQQQPTNSPVGASTSASPAQTASSPQQQDTGLETILAQMAAEQAARDKALQDQLAAQAAAQAAQPQAVMQPNTPAPTSVDVTAPAEQTPPPAPQDYTKYILLGVAGLLGAVLILNRKKR